jgi:hypothetical protein
MKLSRDDKAALVAFLRTLTDRSLLAPQTAAAPSAGRTGPAAVSTAAAAR